MAAIFLNSNRNKDSPLATVRRVTASGAITSRKHSRKKIHLLRCRVHLSDRMTVGAETRGKEGRGAIVSPKTAIQLLPKGNRGQRERRVCRYTTRTIMQLRRIISNKMDTAVAMPITRTLLRGKLNKITRGTRGRSRCIWLISKSSRNLKILTTDIYSVRLWVRAHSAPSNSACIRIVKRLSPSK